MPDVSRVRRAGHARRNSLPSVFHVGINFRRAAVARSEELPLLQREVRELIDADEQKLRALVLINIVLVAAVAKARGRTVFPGNDMLRCVVTLVHRARHVPPAVGAHRRFPVGLGAPEEQRVAAPNPLHLSSPSPTHPVPLSPPYHTP